MPEPKVLIIGAGTFGTSTAYHLAQTYHDPSQVTLIDQWGTPGPSSRSLTSSRPKDTAVAAVAAPAPAAIDVNRIIRTDYVNPLYCNLANEAIHPWFWDINLGHFFHKTGWIVLDEHGSNFIAHVRQTFQQRGSDYTKDVDLCGLDLEKQWGVVGILKEKKKNGMMMNRTEEEKGDFARAYYNPEAGWCDAASATATFMSVAEKKGVKRVTAEVHELLFDKDEAERRGRVTVTGVRTTDGRQWTADKIVLATGAWTSRLLAPVEDALRLGANDRIERQIRAVGRISAYYMLSPQETDRMCGKAELPVLVYGSQGILTPPSRENRTLKINDLKTEFVNTVTTPSGHRISVPPSARRQDDVPEKLKLETEKLLTRMVPSLALDRKPDRWRICWDALTPTGDWLLCRHPHPQLDNLYVAVGGNFSSYKFMPVVGKYVCNVLKGNSNGVEKDEAWSWKSNELLQRGESEKKELGCSSSLVHRPELSDFGDNIDSRVSSRL